MRKFDELHSKIINLNHSELEVTNLGSIDLSDDEYMKRKIDSFTLKDLKTVHIHVYSGEGTIPHFHLVSENEKFHTCICIDKPEYFHHGKYNGVLSSKQKKLLYDHLKTKIKITKNVPEMSVWQTIVFIWDSDLENKFKVESTEIPDYTKLPDK